MTDAATPRPCLNCATELQGSFCHCCGQRDQARRLPLKTLLHDVLHDIWHLDHKVLETLRLLVTRPGLLTLAYLEGRRSRYVPPFRLYIFVSFTLFFAFSMFPASGSKKSSSAPSAVTVGSVSVNMNGPAAESTAQPEWVKTLTTRVKAAKQDPERFQHTFLSNLSKSLFLLMPIFAVMLQFLYLRRKPLFVDHMILSIHHHTLSFLVILALLGLAALPGEHWGELPGFALLLFPPLHLAASLRRLHDQGWIKSLLKATAISIAYGGTVLISLTGLLWLSLPKG
jgi:hypothetical protein